MASRFALQVTQATKFLLQLRLIPGIAVDLTTADVDGRLWDFDSKEVRDRALKKVRGDRPMLLIENRAIQDHLAVVQREP